MIRQATATDFNALWAVYLEARAFMKETGNPNQWGDFNPTKEMLEKDIDNKQLYVVERDDGICGVFFFDFGPDPWYAVIENGAWISDTPYGVIHRIAAKTTSRGIFKECLDFVLKKTPHVRIDTHEDNKVMQYVLDKNGFKRCGIVYMDNGEPRIAYELIV